VQALKWDVAAVTAADLVDVMLCQLQSIIVDDDDDDDASERRLVVRHHALTFVILTALGTQQHSLHTLQSRRMLGFYEHVYSSNRTVRQTERQSTSIYTTRSI